MELVDSHAHLIHEAILPNINRVLELSIDKKVFHIVNVGYSLTTNEEVIKFKKPSNFDINIYSSIGLHPTKIDYSNCEKQLQEFFSQIEKYKNKIIAIGEVGLDYYWISDEKQRKIQKEVLYQIFKFNENYNFPIVIHCRNAWKDLIEVLENVDFEIVILHCFSGGKKDVKKLLSLKKEIYFSFATNLLRNTSYINVLKEVPTNRLLFETDSPYLSPLREFPNTPANVAILYEFVSKELCEKNLDKIILNNFRRAFKLL